MVLNQLQCFNSLVLVLIFNTKVKENYHKKICGSTQSDPIRYYLHSCTRYLNYPFGYVVLTKRIQKVNKNKLKCTRFCPFFPLNISSDEMLYCRLVAELLVFFLMY